MVEAQKASHLAEACQLVAAVLRKAVKEAVVNLDLARRREAKDLAGAAVTKANSPVAEVCQMAVVRLKAVRVALRVEQIAVRRLVKIPAVVHKEQVMEERPAWGMVNLRALARVTTMV